MGEKSCENCARMILQNREWIFCANCVLLPRPNNWKLRAEVEKFVGDRDAPMNLVNRSKEVEKP